MEELEFNRMIYAIVSGLYEKEQNNDKYPYSTSLSKPVKIGYSREDNRKDRIDGTCWFKHSAPQNSNCN